MLLTQERLHSLLSYQPVTGIFRWRSAGGHRCGKIAGYKTTRGYVDIKIDGVRYKAHRLAWFYVHGVWPSELLDHINGDTSDSRITNLRECTNTENIRNQRRHKNNQSGYKGVHWYGQSAKWRAALMVDRKSVYIGLYDSPLAAAQAYNVAAIKAFGEFACLNEV